MSFTFPRHRINGDDSPLGRMSHPGGRIEHMFVTEQRGQSEQIGQTEQAPRRQDDLEFAELRVWLAEVDQNARQVTQHAPDSLHCVAEQVAGLGSALESVDLSSLTGEELMGTVLALEAIRRRLEAVSAVALGQLDATHATESSAGLRTKRWKANRTHASDATVARELRIASTLARFGEFATSLAAGHISTDHVLALANAANPRVIDALIEIEAPLVSFAQRHRYAVFVRHLRHLVALLDQDGSEPDCNDHDTARMALDGEDHLHLVVELTGHNAVVAQHVLDAETDRQYRAAVREKEASGIAVPPTPVLRARAVAELLRRGAGPQPRGSKPAVEAILPITVDRLGRPTGVHTMEGAQIDAATAAVLLCDAHLHPVVVDASGNPLNVGRTERFFTADQRRALVVRDGGCAFPGCDQAASRCDAHHEIPWGENGKTDTEFGVLLCRRHHGLLHGHNPWSLATVAVCELPASLADAHRARARAAGLEPSERVRIWNTPSGEPLLAQVATDHRGPAPPRRQPAA